jgi:hypothetical protein
LSEGQKAEIFVAINYPFATLTNFEGDGLSSVWPDFFIHAQNAVARVCFQTKNPNLGKFWRALDWKMLISFLAIWNILWSFGMFWDHLVQFVFMLYIFSGVGIMHQEKSGYPGRRPIRSII